MIPTRDVRSLGYGGDKLSLLKDDIMAKVSGFDYGKSSFLKDELNELYHPKPDYVPIR